MPPQTYTGPSVVYNYATPLHWITIFLIFSFTVIILFQATRIILHPEKCKMIKCRYLLLTILFLLFNTVNNLLPNTSFLPSIFIQHSIECALGMYVCIYAIWYLYTEFNITSRYKLFKVKYLFLTMTGCYFLLFILPYYFTESLQFAYKCFLIYPIILSLAFVVSFFYTVKKYISYSRDFKLRTYLALSAVIFLSLSPILTWFHVFEPWIISITSISFFLISIMELDSYLYRLKNTHKLKPVKPLHPKFTDRENEIAHQIINEADYSVISKKMFIQKSTVRKHASNIFSKSNCSNRQQFIKKFKR
uniref:helix-turn-helix transcriptional regulator n=1 Tax=Formosa sp. 3Alg 14/1 TaxID=3382190 RepID=UPI0039BE3F76